MDFVLIRPADATQTQNFLKVIIVSGKKCGALFVQGLQHLEYSRAFSSLNLFSRFGFFIEVNTVNVLKIKL
jgi:hypothetical protein